MSNPAISAARAPVPFKAQTPDSDIWEDIDSSPDAPIIPLLYLSLPPIRDLLETHTSDVQDNTVQEILPYLAGDHSRHFSYNPQGVPALKRHHIIPFLKKFLSGLPALFYAADASRPWFLYWCLGSLAMLGQDVKVYRKGMVKTAEYLQNETGGFGGSFGHTSHLATTYAVVLALVTVGGEEAYKVIDRKAMWEWLSLLKQEDGGFQLAYGGEVDVRGAYCASVIISLLNLPLELAPTSPLKGKVNKSFNLFTKLGDYVRRCQTYEGGMSGRPDGEAHGAYAFCALGCLSIIDIPFQSIPQYLNVSTLISWLSARQNAPEGGLSGRTNKLVDGCYSHWVGGCWPILEAVLNGPVFENARDQTKKQKPFVESIMSREGLIRYILCCCQDENLRAGTAGMRDKPGKSSDCYHSLYVLAGLSFAQHSWNLHADPVTGKYTRWEVTPYDFPEGPIFDEQAHLEPLHPLYVVPTKAVDEVKAFFKNATV